MSGRQAGGLRYAGSDGLAMSFLLRAAVCLPLVAVCLAFAVLSVIGVSRLPGPELAALPKEYGRAALTALVCLVLATPGAAGRPSLVWAVPLAATAAAGAAGWMLLPLPASAWSPVLEGAVLLLPVMVLVLGIWWRRIPPALADTASAQGARRWRVFFMAVAGPAMPGVARGLAVVFVLALGLAPLLAPASGSP